MVIGLPLGLGIALISAVTLENLVAWPRLCTPSLLGMSCTPLPCLALLFIVLSTKKRWTGHQTYLVPQD